VIPASGQSPISRLKRPQRSSRCGPLFYFGDSFHWWAREDSNLQPDRYERPALTFELRARAEPDDDPGTDGVVPYNDRPAATTDADEKPGSMTPSDDAFIWAVERTHGPAPGYFFRRRFTAIHDSGMYSRISFAVRL
jgi:hypothetical protein